MTLESMGIDPNKVPINPFEVIIKNKWQIATYSMMAPIFQWDRKSIRRHIARHAFSAYSFDHNSYLIAYDETHSPEVIRWAICHEIGHIYYGDISPLRTVDFKSPEKVTADQQRNRRLREHLANHFADFVLGKVSVLLPSETIAQMRGNKVTIQMRQDPYPMHDAGISAKELFRLLQSCYNSFEGCNNDLGSVINTARTVCVEPNRIYTYQCPLCGRQAKAYIDGNDGSIHPGCDCYMTFLDTGLPWG